MSVNSKRMDGGFFAGALPRISEGIYRNRVVLLLALILNVGDVLSTHIGLARGLPEGNPIPAMLLANGGQMAMFSGKVAVFAAVLLVVCTLGDRYPKLWHTFTALNVILLLVVVSNTAQILSP
jgi:hypothetical protein